MSDFRPVLYLKESCPFCLKVAAFLVEAGLFGGIDTRTFWPDDEREQPIREELAPHFDMVSFPALQYSVGKFINESEDIIAYFAKERAADLSTMPFYAYTLSGPMRQMREQFGEIRKLKQELGQIK